MKVLLVVDMQKGFMKNNDYWVLSDRISNLVNNGGYDKVIFTKFINDRTKNSLYEDRLNWLGFQSEEEQEFSFLLPQDAIVFNKYGYGLGEDCLQYIAGLHIDEIDICGVQAEACVYAIALQLWDRGIMPKILNDYVLGNVEMGDVFAKQFGCK